MVHALKKTKFDIFIQDQYLVYSKKNKIITIIILLLLLALIFYYVSLKPNLNTIEKLNTQIKLSNQEVEKIKITINDLPLRQKELENIKNKFEIISSVFPKSQEIPDLLRIISDIGKNSGLEIISFAPAQEIYKDFYSEVPIDIKIKGTYHNIGLFLYNISNLERIVTVHSIKVDKVNKEKHAVLLESTCKFLTYRFSNKNTEQSKKKN